MPHWVRLHHIDGSMDNQTHVPRSPLEHVSAKHVARLPCNDQTIKTYALESGGAPAECLPEHVEYFQNLRVPDNGPLACEIYESEEPRPVPEAPVRKIGGLTSEDMEHEKSRVNSRMDAIDSRMDSFDGKLDQILGALTGSADAKPETTPAEPSTPEVFVKTTKDGIPETFSVPGDAAKEKPDDEITDDPEDDADENEPESTAQTAARARHATMVAAGHRDKKPLKQQKKTKK